VVSQYGFNEFIICLGYKGYVIKEYFANYFIHQSDITIDMENNKIETHNHHAEPWKVTLIDTGDKTLTGGRILRIKEYVKNETFMMTYGDGVANVNIKNLIKRHREKNKIATVTAAQPFGRFGSLDIDKDNNVRHFIEKPAGDGAWVNAGFFVLETAVFKYIEHDLISFEREPLEKVAKENQLAAFHHKGFWMPMDKLSDKVELEKLWDSGKAPWKIW